jgi:hypothetical protein
MSDNAAENFGYKFKNEFSSTHLQGGDGLQGNKFLKFKAQSKHWSNAATHQGHQQRPINSLREKIRTKL